MEEEKSMMKFFKSDVFWRFSCMANIVWAVQSAMGSVLCYNEGMTNKALFFAVASLIHTRLIFYCGDRAKKLEKK